MVFLIFSFSVIYAISALIRTEQEFFTAYIADETLILYSGFINTVVSRILYSNKSDTIVPCETFQHIANTERMNGALGHDSAL